MRMFRIQYQWSYRRTLTESSHWYAIFSGLARCLVRLCLFLVILAAANLLMECSIGAGCARQTCGFGEIGLSCEPPAAVVFVICFPPEHGNIKAGLR